MTGSFVFVGRCDALDEEDLADFDDSSRGITFRTFQKAIGVAACREFVRELGYDRSLPITKDWHVSYAKGLWRGRRAVCCFWSAYHHIFVEDSDDNGADSVNELADTLGA